MRPGHTIRKVTISGLCGLFITLAIVVLPSLTLMNLGMVSGESSSGDTRYRSLTRTHYQAHRVQDGSTPPPFGAPDALYSQLLADKFPNAIPMCVLYAPTAVHAFWSATDAGFPCRCTWGWENTNPFPGQPALGGWVDLGPPFSSEHRIPARPLWTGMILDILFWSSLFAASSTAIRAAVSTHRRKMGECVRCRCDRRGLDSSIPCPECGHT